MSDLKKGSVANWDPGAGSKTDKGPSASLMNTEAKDDQACVSGENKLEAFKGAQGKPKGPFGAQGREF